MSNLFVGIDVSKDSSTAKGLDDKGQSKFYIEFKMNAKGFGELLDVISSISKDFSKVLVAMESTGCYHINLFSFLTAKGIETLIINPLLISNFTKLSLRKTKTDKKDAATIAQFILVHKNSLNSMVLSEDIQDLKDLARERESLVFMVSGLKNDIRRMLQITFPELEPMCNIFSETALKFLIRFPSARTIRCAKPRVIANALVHKDKRKRISASHKDIIKAAESSVASNRTAKELILPEKIETILYLMEKRDKITKALIQSCESMMVEDLEVLTSINGISNISGSLFLSEVGDFTSFNSYKNLIAFAGLDPTVNQSGKFKGGSKISKRGNRRLRRIIYYMTFCVVKGDNVFRTYFLKRSKEGLPYRKALIATSHKLIRVIFAMLSSKSKFKMNELPHS